MTGDPEEQGARTLQQALGYARHGWPVFPCIPGEKIPATRHGFEDATTDPQQITRWWHASPGRNLAIATGAPGPDVIDVDNHGEAGNGFGAWNRLRQAGLVNGHQAIVSTPSRGFHAYFRGTEQRNGAITGQHMDFRAQGGYVVAPPSTVGGRPYAVAGHTFSEATVDWAAVCNLLDPPQARPQRPADQRSDIDRLAAHVARLQPGNRNPGLYWAACRAAEASLLDTEGVEALVAAFRLADPGVDRDREARRTIASALKGPGYSQRGRGLDPTQWPQPEREAD